MSLVRAMIKTRRGNSYSGDKLVAVQQYRLKKLVRFARKTVRFTDPSIKISAKTFALQICLLSANRN